MTSTGTRAVSFTSEYSSMKPLFVRDAEELYVIEDVMFGFSAAGTLSNMSVSMFA
jgi:hypothetical protein